MALSTTVVTILSAFSLLVALMSKFEGMKNNFTFIGMSHLVNSGQSRRHVVGTLAALIGGLFASTWVWAIQSQEIVGTTSLCAQGSGCAVALSSYGVNTIPFTDMLYGLFFTLWFSIIAFFVLSIYLEMGWNKAEDFLTYGKWMSLFGTLIAITMLVTQQLNLEGNPVCILFLLLLGASVLQFVLLNDLVKSHDDGSWSTN